MTAPLSHREFIEWFRDKHMVNGMRLQFLITNQAETINLDHMDDGQAQRAAEQIMMMGSIFEGHA